MLTLIRQERYKLMHKKSTWITLALLIAVQVGSAFIRLRNSGFMALDMLINSNYVGGELILFIMIASAATMMAMEFQYGTIRPLLYRQYYRSQVFLSKLLVLVGQLLSLTAIAVGFTWGLTATLFPDFDWQKITANGHPFFEQYWLGLGGTLLVTLLLLSVVVFLATWFKSNAVAIASGYIGYFLMQIAAGVLLALINKWEWLKWNPFTMLMIGEQIANPKNFKLMTHLDTPVMIACLGGYTVLFTLLAYLSFRKRSV